jgi:hypothetical protein
LKSPGDFWHKVVNQCRYASGGPTHPLFGGLAGCDDPSPGLHGLFSVVEETMHTDVIAANAKTLAGWQSAYEAYGELLAEAERHNDDERIKIAKTATKKWSITSRPAKRGTPMGGTHDGGEG